MRQTYTRTLKKLSIGQRFRNHPKNNKKATRADKKVKTITGRLVRELDRNLCANSPHRELLDSQPLKTKTSDLSKFLRVD